MRREILASIVKDESGATAIEYGLILAFMAGAVIAVFTGLGTNLKGLFTAVGAKLSLQTPT